MKIPSLFGRNRHGVQAEDYASGARDILRTLDRMEEPPRHDGERHEREQMVRIAQCWATLAVYEELRNG